ncbi:hypothetical protein [Colwellia piezophila]|uniref:hypothetical protein n=1 Tax=Colwellia piezophila TaxID=211668 RepID=UPI000364CE5C|nr:hypothetical protein [Colwellia piezophila]
MLLLLRFCLLATITLFPSLTTSNEVSPLATSPHTKTITWIIEDTFEWQDFVSKISKTTSQDTAMIIMHGLESLGYQLTVVKATSDRAEKILQSEVNACMSNRMKNPQREIFSFFSLPHDLYLGLQLYRVTQSTPLHEKVLNSQGEIINLARLFQYYPEQILAIASGVSYGAEIDKQIKELSIDNVFVRAGASRITSVANMLLKNRIEYIIYYPQDINALNLDHITLESYTIAGSPPYFLGHVSCSKTAVGEQIISQINDILQQAYLSTEFYYAHEKWLLSGDLPKLRQYYLEVFQFLPGVDENSY